MAYRSNSLAIMVLFKIPEKGGQNDKKKKKRKKSVEKKTQEKQDKLELTSGGSSNVWSAPPKVAVDVEELVQQTKKIFQLVKEKELMFNLDQLRNDRMKKYCTCLCS